MTVTDDQRAAWRRHLDRLAAGWSKPSPGQREQIRRLMNQPRKKETPGSDTRGPRHHLASRR